jgi:glutaredoxin
MDFLGHPLVKERPVLFVKSEKVEQLEYTVPNFGHYCSAAYRATVTNCAFCEEDQKAIELLEKAGISYVLVDLEQASTAMRLKTRVRGIKTTPTLVYEGKKIETLKRIMSTIELVAQKQKAQTASL